MSSINTAGVVKTLGYVQRFKGHTLLIKLGGAALQDPELVKTLCEDLALIRSVGLSVVLVHGGGPAINEQLTLQGIQWNFVEGQRVTTPEMMDVIEMVLCGNVNRRIVRTLNQAGVQAVGISGTDAKALKCRPAHAALGQVGIVESVDVTLIQALLSAQGAGFIPVIAPVGIAQDGTALNVNADTAASKIAQALGIKKLIFLTDQDGILDSQKKLVSELDAGELESLIEDGTVQGGMLAKSRAILDAIAGGVEDVHILNARRPQGLIEELFTEFGIGTVCRSRAVARTAPAMTSAITSAITSDDPKGGQHV